MSETSQFQGEYFVQIRKEAQRLANAGMYKQASVLLSMLHNQWIPETGILSASHDHFNMTASRTSETDNAKDLWNYRLTALKEQLYEQDLKILFSIAGKLIAENEREKAAELLNIFTNLLRLGLRSSAFETSPADTEMELLEQYILLTNQVSDNRFQLMLKSAPRNDWSLHHIPSMSLVPVLKHLLNGLTKFDNAQVDIHLNITDDQQIFQYNMQIAVPEMDATIFNQLGTKLRTLPWCGYLWKAWHECYPPNMQEHELLQVKPALNQISLLLPVID